MLCGWFGAGVARDRENKREREKKRDRGKRGKKGRRRQIKTEKREWGGPSYSLFSLPGAQLWCKLDFSDIWSCKHRQPFFRKWIGRNGGTTLSSNLLCPNSQDPLLWPLFLKKYSECLRPNIHRSGPLHSCTSSVSLSLLSYISCTTFCLAAK